jgi:succinoglycan biosynthesis transport protein ExoP
VALKQLGFRVLVVDANSFTPSTLFKPDQPGLSNFLAGQANLDAVQHTLVYQGECLEAIGFGDQKSTGVQRLDLLQQAVAHWTQHHDYVLVALPPVLLSADAELLIDALGQVFMVMEAQSVSRGEVVRAKRLLEKLDPEAVGLFVNSVPTFQGGGYMQELLLETLTRDNFKHFMSLSNLRLQVELLRARWVQNRMKKKPCA